MVLTVTYFNIYFKLFHVYFYIYFPQINNTHLYILTQLSVKYNWTETKIRKAKYTSCALTILQMTDEIENSHPVFTVQHIFLTSVKYSLNFRVTREILKRCKINPAGCAMFFDSSFSWIKFIFKIFFFIEVL